MSPSDKKSKIEARKLAVQIVPRGTVHFSSHARIEMKADDMDGADVLNVLLSPDSRVQKEPDFERGSYRYCVETRKMAVVVAFSGEDSLVVVTAWRKK